jgi:hypothetical protein
VITAIVKPAKRWFGAKRWRFIIQADNGETIATSETYANRVDAEHTLGLLFSDVEVKLRVLDERGVIIEGRTLR